MPTQYYTDEDTFRVFHRERGDDIDPKLLENLGRFQFEQKLLSTLYNIVETHYVTSERSSGTHLCLYSTESLFSSA